MPTTTVKRTLYTRQLGTVVAPSLVTIWSRPSSLVGGAHETNPPLAGTSDGIGDATGSLANVATPLAGTSAGIGAQTGNAKITRRVSGTVGGTGAQTGALVSVATPIAGTSPGLGAAMGALANVATPVAGTSAGVGSATGALANVATPLAGASPGLGSATGAIANVATPLVGIAAGIGGQTGALAVAGGGATQALAGTSAGIGGAAGLLAKVARALAGASAGIGGAVGALAAGEVVFVFTSDEGDEIGRRMAFASYKLIPGCFRSGQNGGIGEDVSALVLDASVKVDANAEVPMMLSATVTDPGAFPAFSWIVLFLTVSYWDPDEDAHVEITEPVGLFLVMPPGETHTAAQGIGRIEGRDPAWLLKQSTMASGASYAAGSNVVAGIKTDLAARGFTRVNIPPKANTFAKKRAYDPGTPWLDSINDRLHRIGCYPLWFDRQGVPTSRPMRRLSREESARTIASGNGDVVNVVTLDTDTERLANRVTVIRHDAAGDPVFSTKTNARADSPVSTVNLGFTIGKTIEASNVDTQAEADAIALRTLEEGASVLTRLSVDVIPDPRFDVRDVVSLDIRRDDGTVVAGGRWWADQVSIGFRPSAGAMNYRLNKLVAFEPEG